MIQWGNNLSELYSSSTYMDTILKVLCSLYLDACMLHHSVVANWTIAHTPDSSVHGITGMGCHFLYQGIWTELNWIPVRSLNCFPPKKNAKMFLAHRHIFSFNVFFKIICLHQVLVPTSDQFSRSVMPNSLWPRGLQHARLRCPSTTPRVCSDPCPLRRWCHPTISSFVFPLPFSLQSFPAPESFPMSLLLTSSGQVLEHQLQHQSFQWIFKNDFL